MQVVAEQRLGLGRLKVPDFWESLRHSTIRTQSGVIPFEPFDWQRRFVDGITRRELVLKSRDVGSSEIAVRYFCWKMLKESGNVLIKADKHDNACNLIRMARQYLTSLPVGERPELVKDNETELELRDIGTVRALARGGGRSERCRYLLLTERAFWEDSEAEIADVSGALVADGWLIVESTANGFNEYHRLWADETNGYRKTFVSRWENPAHTPDWYRDKTAELQATPSLIGQEYPATSNEAFVASGATVFDKEAILAAQRGSREPIHEQRISDSGFGFLRLWKLPEPGRQYVAGADVAEGKEAGNEMLDYSGVAVLDRDTCEHVADLHGQWQLEVFAALTDKLCRQYNNALLGVERNNHGHAVILVLRQLGYPNLYVHQGGRGGALKIGRTKALPEYGWPSNMVTKPVWEQTLGELISGGLLKSKDKALWDELLTYVHLPNGHTGAQARCHDDRVVKVGIACRMRMVQQFVPVQTRTFTYNPSGGPGKTARDRLAARRKVGLAG